VRGRLTMAQFLASPHLLMSHRGDFEGAGDRALAAKGRRRNVILSTENFGTIPAVLSRIGAIALLPEFSARRFALQYGLATSMPPTSMEAYWSVLVWRARDDASPALGWLRGLVLECARSIAS
jgi:DNA-binding transcriptional LysR family regulator